jgi:hypothetical protein
MGACLENAMIASEFRQSGGTQMRRSRREKRHETILPKPCRYGAYGSRRLGFAGAGKGRAADRDAVAGI